MATIEDLLPELSRRILAKAMERCRLTLSIHDQEDACQTLALAGWRAWSKRRNKSYVAACMVNKAKDIVRYHRRRLRRKDVQLSAVLNGFIDRI